MKQTLKRLLPTAARKKLYTAKTSVIEGTARWTCRQVGRLVGGPENVSRFVFDNLPLTPEIVILGYSQGIFPSPIHQSGRVRWHDPEMRGVMPVQDYHVPRKMRSMVRKKPFDLRVDTDFPDIIRGCAEPAPGRETTFITPHIMEVYTELHRLGFVHCIGAWQDGQLVAGLYGITIGSYFAGESQFHRVPDAGKLAFVLLLAILRAGGFMLHDTWWGSRHIEGFGGTYMPRDEFKQRHAHALLKPATFCALDPDAELIPVTAREENG